MGPRSLYDQAKTAILRNIEMLTDIGDLPYSFMRPVILRLESPAQLRELETTCPQLLGEDGEVWLKFVKRDVSGWEKKVKKYTTYSTDGETATIGPKDPKNWYKLYKTLKRESDEETKLAEEMLFERMEVVRKKREQNTIAAPVDMIPEKRSKGRTGPTTFSRTADKSVLRFTGGTKTKDLMARARRETAEHKAQHSGRLVTPTHLLNGSRVQKAPQGMIEAKKLEASTATATRSDAVTGFRISRAANSSKPTISSELAAREARLKAAQSSASGAAPSSHSSLAPGTTYKVPKLGARGSSPSSSPAPVAKTGPPGGMKRKREVDVFMKSKKR